MKNNTRNYYSPKQGRLPLFIIDFLDICDPVLTFDRITEEIGIEKYLHPEPFCKFKRSGAQQLFQTDHDAKFMRMKKDYMGNDQLLPAYNIPGERDFWDHEI